MVSESNFHIINSVNSIVLILVLMEDGLGVNGTSEEDIEMNAVLILVLVEDGL